VKPQGRTKVSLVPPRAARRCRLPPPASQYSQANTTCHVTGCHSTLQTRGDNVADDAASTGLHVVDNAASAFSLCESVCSTAKPRPFGGIMNDGDTSSKSVSRANKVTSGFAF